jgi:hypothetical protein
MSRLGTDVVALACIVGGAAVGGVGTMALMQGDQHASHDVECVVVGEVGAKVKASSVVVALGGPDRIVVSTPAVNVHRHRPHCVSLDESIDWSAAEAFDMQSAKLGLEQARRQIEMARQLELEALELGRLDLDELSIAFDGIGFELDIGKEISNEIERSLAEEMERLEVELRRLEEIGR